MKTPLALFVSSIWKRPFAYRIRAWRLDTYGSGKTQSFSGRRPMVPPLARKAFRLSAGGVPSRPVISNVRIIALLRQITALRARAHTRPYRAAAVAAGGAPGVPPLWKKARKRGLNALALG